MEDPLLRLGTYSFSKMDDFMEIFQTDFLRKLPLSGKIKEARLIIRVLWSAQNIKCTYLEGEVMCTDHQWNETDALCEEEFQEEESCISWDGFVLSILNAQYVAKWSSAEKFSKKYGAMSKWLWCVYDDHSNMRDACHQQWDA